jgi:BirA family transcriptional regulator, biotin operon repressor / biotin---[acetyl-CoA-carboxylase] ligase
MRRFRIEWFDELDSTNRWLADQARRGADDGLVAIAAHQNAGRGRLDRTWHAPPRSGLLCSVLVRPDAPLERWSLTSAALGLAALDALHALVPDALVAVKWPNDLVVPERGDRKLAGILAELIGPSAAQPGAVVAGIGLNVRKPPEGSLPAEASDRGVWLDELTDRHPVPTIEQLAEFLLAAFNSRIALLEQEPAALLDAARSHSATLGTVVRVETATTVLIGRAVDLDESGALIVEVRPEGEGSAETPAHTLVTILAGEVTRLRPFDGT